MKIPKSEIATTTTTAEETTSPKEEEQQNGRFSFAEIYAYVRDGRYPSNFTKVDKQALRKRAKFFIVKDTQLYYVGGGMYYNVMYIRACSCYNNCASHHGLLYHS